MGIAVGISLLSRIGAEINVLSYLLLAAIFDLRYTQPSNSIPTRLSVLPDPNIIIVFVACVDEGHR